MIERFGVLRRWVLNLMLYLLDFLKSVRNLCLQCRDIETMLIYIDGIVLKVKVRTYVINLSLFSMELLKYSCIFLKIGSYSTLSYLL
jgi:hypothetical protein